MEYYQTKVLAFHFLGEWSDLTAADPVSQSSTDGKHQLVVFPYFSVLISQAEISFKPLLPAVNKCTLRTVLYKTNIYFLNCVQADSEGFNIKHLLERNDDIPSVL